MNTSKEKNVWILALVLSIFIGGGCGENGGGGSGDFQYSGPPGSLDTDFGGGAGYVAHDGAAGTSGNDYGTALNFDSSGHLVVAGHGQSGSNQDVVIWRLDSNGDFDTAFGQDYDADGVLDGFSVYADASGNDDGTGGVAIDSAGNILLAGYNKYNVGCGADMMALRFDTTGTLDSAFGNNGVFYHHNAAGGNCTDRGYAIAVDGSDQPIITGFSYKAFTNEEMVVWRLTTDGILDANFGGGNGFVVYGNVGGANKQDFGNGITIDGLGRIIVTGITKNTSPDTYEMAIWRMDTGGGLDSGFGGAGAVWDTDAIAPGSSNGYGQSPVSDGNGRIVVAGAEMNSTGQYDLVLWRYNSDGTSDTTFGGDYNPVDGILDGVVVYDGGFGNDSGNSAAIDMKGRIVVAGYIFNGADNDLAIWRFHPDGTLDTTFNASGIEPGIFTHDGAAGGPGNDSGASLKLDGVGRIVVTGSSWNGANYDMAVWRINP